MDSTPAEEMTGVHEAGSVHCLGILNDGPVMKPLAQGTIFRMIDFKEDS